tara:strand:+ start:1202 stop:2410 length:1209 start_codon:yes stop_codon:yes gene_type:complete
MFASKPIQNYSSTYGISNLEENVMTDNRPASERAPKGLDFVPHLHALLLFHEKIPLGTLIHIRVFLTLVELCKANPEGIDMKSLRQYIPMDTENTKLIPESSMNRVLKTLSTGDVGFSYKGRVEGFGLIEITPIDKKRKRITVTKEGFEMASQMVDGQKLEFQRLYMDSLIDNVEMSNDYASSAEMGKVIDWLDEGLTFMEVEKKLDAWKKANPDKVFAPRGQQELTMAVPEEVDEDWLAAYQHENSTETGRRNMLLQSGFPDDEIMERMMFTANYRGKGQVSLRISRDIVRNKKFSKSLLEMVERVREINKDGKFVHSPLLQQIADKAVGKVDARKNLKVHTRMKTGVDARTDKIAKGVVAKTIEKVVEQTTRDEEFEAMKSEMAELKAMIKQMGAAKDVG